VAFSVSPGYEFNERVLGYMRLGWASVPYTIRRGSGLPNYKTRLDAYFAGVGAKVNLYRGIYAFAEVRYSEVERVNFTAMRDYEVLPGTQISVPIQGTADTTAVNAFIGLGYRF
jgi:opacity protein-like surface antigen